MPHTGECYYRQRQRFGNAGIRGTIGSRLLLNLFPGSMHLPNHQPCDFRDSIDLFSPSIPRLTEPHSFIGGEAAAISDLGFVFLLYFASQHDQRRSEHMKSGSFQRAMKEILRNATITIRVD